MAQASTICSILDQRDGPGLFRIHLELGKRPSSRRCRATTGSIETPAPILYELTWKTIVVTERPTRVPVVDTPTSRGTPHTTASRRSAVDERLKRVC